MSIGTAEPLARGASELGNFEARMLRTFGVAVDDWDEVCSGLGRWEAENLTKADSSFAKQQHRRWVTKLLLWGRLVQSATRNEAFPDQALAARVNARVRHLEDKLALWHGEMTPAEQERILQAAFP